MKRFLAIVLAVTLIFSVFAGCSGKSGEKANNSKPLVVGYSNFSSKFSPFFAETAYDQDVSTMTQISLLTMDRMGSIIQKGIKGETIAYNGKDYTYYGPADLDIKENTDGTVDYNFTLRDDVVFSDGEKVTVDDVLFSMYVLCDPTYDGSSTLFALPIKGMEDYRSGMEVLGTLLLEAGKDNKDFKLWDEATQTAFWGEFDKAGEAFAQSIVDYCIANGINAEGDSVAKCAANWGYELKEDATAADFFNAILDGYDTITEAVETEVADKGFFECFSNPDDWKKAVETGKSAASIEGIKKTGDNTFTVTLTEVDATAIYNLGINIAPMHYYGDKAKFDIDKNMFGFDKGDLSSVRAKTKTPMGAGPYKFVKFENGVVYFEANDKYYLGAPKTTNVQFKETNDTDKLNGVITNSIDITDPSYSLDTQKAIKEANDNGEITGSKITTSLVENLGYGYMAMSAKAVKVGDKLGSDESKALRKAFATVFANYRDLTVDSYYGDTAEVINYPISNTSWAAPKATDPDYAAAFSKDVDGKDIYTADMTKEAREEASLKAALGFLEKAGYTVADGKVTKAPEGAKLEYTAWIPADGSGDHPAFMMLKQGKDALAKIGITINIKDLANSSELWTSLDADQVDMWCAAWGATPDPDMYQVYFSGDGKNAPGGSQKHYDIDDQELNKLILDARKSLDQSFRKTMYKDCLDIILDWGVEIPVYQRKNAVIFSTERVNIDSVTPDITPFYPWLSEIQNITLK